MKRGIKYRPRRNRPPVDWPALQERVTRRDAANSAAKLRERLDPVTAARMITFSEFPCVAWIIEGGPITCHGPWHLDHVKDDARMAQKAPDDEYHLVSLCAAHDERGMTAGAVWCTANRPAL